MCLRVVDICMLLLFTFHQFRGVKTLKPLNHEVINKTRSKLCSGSVPLKRSGGTLLHTCQGCGARILIPGSE